MVLRKLGEAYESDLVVMLLRLYLNGVRTRLVL